MARAPSRQPGLFAAEPAWPEGLVYRPDFVSRGEEASLLQWIAALTFGEVRMHGVTARRRVVQLGWHYTFDARRLEAGTPVPSSLNPLRARIGELTGRDPEAFAEVLVTEYRPGAGIGWHRDAPAFGVIAGVSLASACTLRLRRGEAGNRETMALDLEPRSVYVLDGPARTEWQHGIPAARALRYSITFRTLRGTGDR